jgi:hypothetical protein
MAHNLQKPKPLVIPKLKPKKIGLAQTTIDLKKRLEERRKKAAKK